MAIRIVRLGTPREPGEGPRLATVRRPPRGVRREDYAPSGPLVSYAKSKPLTPARWRTFARRYRSEMRTPAARRLLATLALLSAQANFSVGCYCADESHCHRSLLRQLLLEAGATVL